MPAAKALTVSQAISEVSVGLGLQPR